MPISNLYKGRVWLALRDALFLGGKVIDVAINWAGPKVLTARHIRIVKVPCPLPCTRPPVQGLLADVLRHGQGKGRSVSYLFDKWNDIERKKRKEEMEVFSSHSVSKHLIYAT